MAESKKVLVVDDDEFVYLAVTHIFEKIGYEVVSANNGKKALRLAGEQTPRCIFLDIQMPGMDGLEVCSHIRSNPATAKTPVIFVSAKDVSRGFDDEIEAGGDFFVSKPFLPDDLAVDLYYLNELNFAPSVPETAKLRVAKALPKKKEEPSKTENKAAPKSGAAQGASAEASEALATNEASLRERALHDDDDEHAGDQEHRDLRLLMLSNSYRLSALIRILEGKGIIKKGEVDNVLRSIVGQEKNQHRQ